MVDAYGLQTSLVQCSFDISLDYSLPSEIYYSQFYNGGVEKLTEKQWK